MSKWISDDRVTIRKADIVAFKRCHVCDDVTEVWLRGIHDKFSLCLPLREVKAKMQDDEEGQP